MRGTSKIPRSEGLTDAERYLKKLCDLSFLTLWSYPGVFNDKGPGQEVCDLLVVFDNHLIIFSDKDCEYPDTGNPELDWSRWYRKAIKKSADQIYGAERWLLTYPNRVFLDQACKIRFPIEIPTSEDVKIHRVVVAHSASLKCSEILGGSGSLLLTNEEINDSRPFTVGRLDSKKGFVHILDDTTLDILLSTLDTISDFVSYLEKKERFLDGSIRFLAAGEEELLSVYLRRTNQDGEHDFLFDRSDSDFSAISLDQGLWREFSSNPQRQAQIDQNRVSYFWDSLIESFAKHFNEGTSHFNTHEDVITQENLLRLLAKENRTMRRMLSKAFLEFVGKSNPLTKSSRVFIPERGTDTYYVFLTVPANDAPYAQYREIRREMLYAHCIVTKLDHPSSSHIIGLATESGRINEGSEDLVYLDAREWTQKEKSEAEELKRRMVKAKILSPYHKFEKTEYEYPPISAPFIETQPLPFKGRHVNKLCPCGSGRKIKKCCAN